MSAYNMIKAPREVRHDENTGRPYVLLNGLKYFGPVRTSNHRPGKTATVEFRQTKVCKSVTVYSRGRGCAVERWFAIPELQREPKAPKAKVETPAPAPEAPAAPEAAASPEPIFLVVSSD